MIRIKAIGRDTPGLRFRGAWRGYFSIDDAPFEVASSSYGPIIYQTKAYALAGARVCADGFNEKAKS